MSESARSANGRAERRLAPTPRTVVALPGRPAALETSEFLSTVDRQLAAVLEELAAAWAAEDAQKVDVLADRDGIAWFEADRVETRNTHGTGCTLSSAIAAELGKGCSPQQAIGTAKRYLADAIARAHELDVGSGHGPVHHFHALW